MPCINVFVTTFCVFNLDNFDVRVRLGSEKHRFMFNRDGTVSIGCNCGIGIVLKESKNNYGIVVVN